jgi:hypothetical protein
MIVNYDTPLVGASAFVTATPFCVTGDEFGEQQVFIGPAMVQIGDTVVICEPPDAQQNLVGYCTRSRETFRLHGNCLTLLPSAPPPMHRDVDYISAEIAAHVLYPFNGTGYRAGSFISKLIDALMTADPENQARLAWGFPGYVAAVRLAKNNAHGIKYLQARMRGDEKITEQLENIGAVE